MDATTALADLRSANPAARSAAAEWLAQHAEQAAPGAVTLVELVADRDRTLAEWCVAALENVEIPRMADLPALGKLLASHEHDIAWWAATLLGRAKSQASSYVPQLEALIRSAPQATLRERAAWAVKRITA